MFLIDYLANHARQAPDKPVVIHGNRRLTYAELDSRSSGLAALLRETGVVKGDRVVLFMENSPEYIVAYFGVQKTGAIVVALNSLSVPRELMFLFDDCAPAAVITTKTGRASVDAAFVAAMKKPPVIEITVETGITAAGRDAVDPALSMNDCASIIYTSGTTGKPKGVMLTHRNVTANARSIVEYLHLGREDIVMVILPFYYSYGSSLLTTHIMCGGTIVIDNRFLYPNVVLDTMKNEQVTGFAGVPSHYAILLRKSALRNYAFPKLRYVTQAGGAMSPSMIREFTQLFPQTKFYVMYGQTEATARLSYLEPGCLEAKFGSIGTAIPGVELGLVDEAGNPVAPGETGEIIARGENIMAGYWHAPEETAKVLRNGTLYTGDLARQDAEGFFYIVSRKKDMIKSGANRISPHEIEDVVCRIPGVFECAAIGMPDEIMGELIRLFVVRAEDSLVTDKDIIISCKQNLASYKVPREVVFVASLLKTASGKIKREELRKTAGTRE